MYLPSLIDQYPFPSMLVAALVFLFLLLIIARKILLPKCDIAVPPGSYGWPILGETLDLILAGRGGKPECFVMERMNLYGSSIFKTSLLGEKMVVFCSVSGIKFLFANENKLVTQWWPRSAQILLGRSLSNLVGDDARRVRRVLMSFMNTNALASYIKIVDEMTQTHLSKHWQGKDLVKVYPTVKEHTFDLACRIFMSLDDPIQISILMRHFFVFLKGIMSLPFNFPGTNFYKSTRATKAIRKELRKIVRSRQEALRQKIATPSQDLLSHLIVTADENGKFFTEDEIVSNLLAMLFAGHDTSSSAITMTLKYLAEIPDVCSKVLQEQLNIASTRKQEEFLGWIDLHKMKYSWNVISEIMRLSPPITGSFRQAIVEFNYEGFTIPKGQKIIFSIAAQHRDPVAFENAEKFDASRFEGNGPSPFTYIPFGGGPRMCLGMEFARLEILVFLHNVITKFKWEKVFSDEKVVFDPIPVPAQGLPVHVMPRNG